MTAHRNQTLDLLKLFAAYMVVFIHVQFPGTPGMAADALARFAVPLFFTVSGYFSRQASPKILVSRILHTLRLFLLGVIVYTVWNVAFALMHGGADSVQQHFNQYFSLRTWAKFLLVNVPVSSEHLWFLPALAYVYLTYCIVLKLRLRESAVFSVSLLLLAATLLLGEGLHPVLHLPIVSTRNFLMLGIPFFGLGLLLRKHSHALKNTPDFRIFLLLVAGIAQTLVSRQLIGRIELYLGSVFILAAFFILALKHGEKSYPPLLAALASCSTYIYIFHALITRLLFEIYALCGIVCQELFLLQMVHPLLVCLLSTLLACCLNTLSAKRRRSAAPGPFAA